MRWFDNLSLNAKLMLSFAFCGGILFAAVVYCVIEIRVVGGHVNSLTRDSVPSLHAAGEISQLRLRYRVRSLEYMMAADDERPKMEASLAELNGKLQQSLEAYGTLAQTDEERRILAAAVADAAAYRAAVDDAITKLHAGDVEGAQQIRKTTWVSVANHFRDQTDALAKLEKEAAASAGAASAGAIQRATLGGTAALVVGGLLAALLAWLVARRITARLSGAVRMVEQIASGDLRDQTMPEGRDEVGQLLAAMIGMRSGLRKSLQRLARSAEAIAGASAGLAESASSLTQGTDIQSASAAAMAQAVEEFTASIGEVADITRQAAGLAGDADAQARIGRESTERLVMQIGRVAEVVNGSAKQIELLESESGKISGIVSVIKDIADQTNLLALNAAIEAARAGEQGRGFAVVADEVRTLSERTAQSTQEIASMVTSIQQAIRIVVGQVAEGARLSDQSVVQVRESGEVIQRLQTIAQQVARIVEHIDQSLAEQSAASTAMAQRIDQISIQAEQTSRVSKESSANASQLDYIAADLQKMAVSFKT